MSPNMLFLGFFLPVRQQICQTIPVRNSREAEAPPFPGETGFVVVQYIDSSFLVVWWEVAPVAFCWPTGWPDHERASIVCKGTHYYLAVHAGTAGFQISCQVTAASDLHWKYKYIIGQWRLHFVLFLCVWIWTSAVVLVLSAVGVLCT